MLLIGINPFHGDSSAAIVREGELISAAEEERFTRQKHWAGMPIKAIKYCLASAGAFIEDVDCIVLSKNPFAHLGEKIYTSIKNPSVGFFNRANVNTKILNVKKHFMQSFSCKKNIKAQITFVEHHKAHGASACFGSAFKDSLTLSCDGTGDMRSAMWGTMRDSELKIKGAVNFPHSLGFLYTAFTQFLGFLEYGDEYKVMGLAPYGKPAYKNEIYKIVKIRNDSKFTLNISYFDINKKSALMTWDNCNPEIGRLYSDRFIKYFGKARLPNEPIDDRHKDLACSLQRILEEVILSLLKKLKSKYRHENLCLSGGVFANSVLCGKISDLKLFNRIYVPPAPGDAGTALGALAYFYYKKTGKKIKNISNPYLGPEYDSKEIEKAINNSGLKHEKLSESNMLALTVNALIDRKIVGWFQGRMEFGCRALGNRSILAHPGYAEMKDILNSKIKNREPFRPFAPSVMKEHAEDFFYINNKSPYMSFVSRVKEEKAAKIPAVIHVDNTSRVHTVSKENNPLFHKLLERFYQKTGIPLLLNTSFNENEPIVNAPEEAIDCFLRTKMDVLIMGSFIIRKQ